MEEFNFFEKIKTGKETHNVLIHPDCKICKAKDSKGKSMRANIDKYSMTHSYNDTVRYAQMYVLNSKVSIINVKRHLEKHSPYVAEVKEHIKNLAEETAMDRFNTLDENLDPDEVILEIITKGGRRVKTGEIEIDGKMLLGALKEQGTRRKFGTLRDVLESLDKVRFGELPIQEGKLLEDVDSTTETTTDLQG